MSDYVDEPVPANEVEDDVAVNAEVEEPVAEEVEEPAPANEVAVEDPAPANEVAVEDPAPVEEVAEEDPAPAEVEEPVSTQEVVQNVQEMLTTEPAVSSDSASLEERVKVLEERVKVLEERLEKLIDIFIQLPKYIGGNSNKLIEVFL